MNPNDFIDLVLRNPINREILARLPDLGLPDSWLVAGCLFQTVWNIRSGRPPGADIKDYDIFYHDPSDLSWEAEDMAIRRAAGIFADLTEKGVVVEVRNQARVHLWYPARFGIPYAPLASSAEGIGRFLVAGTCVGLRADAQGRPTDLCAPFGLDDLAAGLLRPNPRLHSPDRCREKMNSYAARWPWLRILEGAEGGGVMCDSCATERQFSSPNPALNLVCDAGMIIVEAQIESGI